VAVGRYGIRTRESIYSKELAKDYSKNKVIGKNTLTVGMGSVQIDIGILTDDVKYSVSPAYHTYTITGINPDYLRYSANIVERLAKEFGKDEGIVGWQIDNEIYHHGAGCCCE
jgi:type I restriction enzyme S subunit